MRGEKRTLLGVEGVEGVEQSERSPRFLRIDCSGDELGLGEGGGLEEIGVEEGFGVEL